jgi:hypothetical protein
VVTTYFYIESEKVAFLISRIGIFSYIFLEFLLKDFFFADGAHIDFQNSKLFHLDQIIDDY